MQKKNRKFNVTIKPICYICLAVSILIFPLSWVTAWFLAAAFHECCHLFALVICKCFIHRVIISPTGMYIQADVSGKHEILCAMAGPLGGCILLAFGRYFPRVAICAFLQTVCNFIPLYPLDGGRVLQGVLRLFFSMEKVEQTTWIVGRCFVVVMIVICLNTCMVYNLGLLPVFMILLLLLKTRVIKIPCKDQQLQVQ